jgi:hypothetical protein
MFRCQQKNGLKIVFPGHMRTELTPKKRKTIAATAAIAQLIASDRTEQCGLCLQLMLSNQLDLAMAHHKIGHGDSPQLPVPLAVSVQFHMFSSLWFVVWSALVCTGWAGSCDACGSCGQGQFCPPGVDVAIDCPAGMFDYVRHSCSRYY